MAAKKEIKKETIILSLGGSLIYPEKIDNIDTGFLKEFRQLILELIDKGYSFIIICGGGKIARKYQAALREIMPDADNKSADWMGIELTRTNAFLIKSIFGKQAHPKIITNPAEKFKARNSARNNANTVNTAGNKIIIGAGSKPGWTTDNVAAIAAKTYGAKTIINMSNIEYIYNKDPNKSSSNAFSDASSNAFSDASSDAMNNVKKIERMSWPEFRKMFGETCKPGGNYPFDPVAGKNAAKFNLKVIILNGRELANLKDCIEGKKFKGSVIG